MKKLILLLIGIILSVNIFCQTDTVYITHKKDTTKIPAGILPDSTKLTALKVYNDTKAGITGIAKALKAPVEHIYYILVKQQIVTAVVWGFLFIIAICFLFNFFKALKSTEEWTNDYDASVLGVYRMIQGILSCILLIICLFNIDNIVTGIINPEYGAIKDIMDFIKPNK